ncbi:MAG: pilus assembly protein PilE [Paucimonas sp.]|nr:pilus assembly protein PilE [Paucimonas sp.]
MPGKHHRPGTGFTGFTLVEMMVVLVVAAILASIAYPAYLGLLARSRRSEAQAALLRAMQQQERIYTLTNRYAAFSQDDPQGFAWHSGPAPKDSAYELSATACADETLETCVRVEARPGTDAVNTGAGDSDCGVLNLDSRGERGASGNGTRCWN